MIQFKQIREKAEEAFNKGEMFEFLTGRNGYDLKVLDAPVDVPTDWTRIIPNGIYKLYEDTKNIQVAIEYQKAILKAINGSAQDLWGAINILYFQFDHENMNKTPFKLNRQLVNGLVDYINLRKAELEKEYPYGEDDWNMYEDICRLNNNYEEDWGTGFLN